MTVVISTPVRPPAQDLEETICVDNGGPGRPSAQVTSRIDLTSNQEFLGAVFGGQRRFHYASRDKLCVVSHPAEDYRHESCNAAAYEVATVSLGIQAIHQAFAAHVALSLTPDVLWYMIVHEVAEHVRQNTGRYAGIFTSTPESMQAIVVRDDSLRRDEPSDWQCSIRLVRDPLRARISDWSMDLFLPQFSTTTEEAETALLVALMDVVSSFHRFEWGTACGIPQIRLEGDAADWQSLHFRADQLAREFGGLCGYFADLLPVLQTIAETASGMTPDEDFWLSIYKAGDHSGGPYVNGWITAFFAHLQTDDGPRFKDQFGFKDPFDWRSMMSNSWGGYTTNRFPSHVSTVPFVWDYLGTRHNMAFAAGVTGVDFDEDTFLAPRLGFAVAETRELSPAE
jgi:hypothetical protein